jgi:hypothetical protein
MIYDEQYEEQQVLEDEYYSRDPEEQPEDHGVDLIGDFLFYNRVTK